jgi:hypothetical protein
MGFIVLTHPRDVPLTPLIYAVALYDGACHANRRTGSVILVVNCLARTLPITADER